jgi:type II secretory pathway pseudopilin PulG
VLELLVAVSIVGILAVIAAVAVITARRAASEASAIGNLKAIAAAEMTLYARRTRFGVLDELFRTGLLVSGQFKRGPTGTGAEAIADATYEYSIRFTRDAAGITIDADPLPPYRRTHRRFRFRLGRRTRSGVSGSEGLLLVAPPSSTSPPPRAYKPLG